MTIDKRRFGRTGHMSSALIFGAAGLGKVDQGTADRVLDLLLEYGVNHLDVAPRYGDAELRIGPWMDRHRKEFFLATKTNERSYQAARDQIRLSLELLRTDHVDLLQMHALYHPDEWDQAFGPGGALEALIEAREQGLARFLGVTGHGWTVAAMHRRSLERFDFDTVLMPWNWFCARHVTYPKDFAETVRLCKERDVAVQTIKGLARGPWAAGAERNRDTWYQPLEDNDDIEAAAHWVLGRGDVFMIAPGDVRLLPKVLKAAASFRSAPDDAVMASFAERAGLATIFGL
jgi:aryl-alcohol dehydrogenase-like predicted oxidoreductase